MPKVDYDELDKFKTYDSDFEWFNLENNGDSSEVIFLVDTKKDLQSYVAHQVQCDGKQRWVDCLRSADDDIEVCPLCQHMYENSNDDSVRKVKAIFIPLIETSKIDKEGNVKKGSMTYWQRSRKFVEANIDFFLNNFGPMTDYICKVTRIGEKKSQDTTYRIDKIKDLEIDKTQLPEPVELLGKLIQEISFEDMVKYLSTGKLPEREEETENIQKREKKSVAPARRTAKSGKGF